MTDRHAHIAAGHADTEAAEPALSPDVQVTLTDAARLTGASRPRLYRAIQNGKLIRNPDHTVSVQALLDAGFEVKTPMPPASSTADHVSFLLAEYASLSHEFQDSLQEQISLLQAQLRLSQQREAQLMQLLREAQAGRMAAATPEASCDAPSQTHVVAFDDAPAPDVTPQATPPVSPLLNTLALPDDEYSDAADSTPVDEMASPEAAEPTMGIFGWRRPKT